MNSRSTLARLAPSVVLPAFLFVAAPALGQMEEPTVPAKCREANSQTDNPWLTSVTSTSNTITMTFKDFTATDPDPAGSEAQAWDLCYPNTATTYGSQQMGDVAAADRDNQSLTVGPTIDTCCGSTITLEPATDYWVAFGESYEEEGKWHYIRTKAASSGPTITISGGSAVTEGTAAEFTVTASEAPSAALTVNLTVADASGSDFVASGDEGSKTVTIAASNTTATYSVSTVADTTDEPNGDVTVTVATGTGYTVGTTSSASVTVNDDDNAPTAPCAASSSPFILPSHMTLSATTTTVKVVYANQGVVQHEFQLCKSGSSAVHRSSGTTHNTTHTFSNLDPDTDYWVRTRETTTTFSAWKHIRTLVDADAFPTITIAGGSAVTEGSAAEFTVTADEAPSADLVVNLTVSESAGSDYVASGNEGSQTVTITASTTSATYSVATEADTTNEPNGTVTVALASGSGYQVGATNSADVTVNDDDAAGITGAEITSTPAFGDTYRRNENVEVTVTWDEDVTWDVSATNAAMRVRLDIGGTRRTAALVTGGATSGTARSLAFRYAVVQADTDSNGLAATTTMGGDLVILVNSATLQDASGTAASRQHAGLAANASHKVDGSVVTSAPAAPAAPTVAAAASTILSVSWTAPTNLGSASAITDYDLRYYAGASDPTDTADWIEEGEMGGPPDPGMGTSARITGLTKGTAYRVQVRALGDQESPWSASASGTPANQAPRVLEEGPREMAGDPRHCVVKTDTTTAWATVRAPFFFLVHAGPVSARESDDTGEFPAICTTEDFDYPMFDDPDGDELTFTISHTPQDNVVILPNMPRIDGSNLFFGMVAALRDTDYRVDVTATDPSGLTATTFVLFQQLVYTGTSAPAFSDTVPARTYTVNQEITELQLPEASGGDLRTEEGEHVFGYFYQVSGLPAGLSFDADTRKITGTPTAVAGATTVTYTAADDDKTTDSADTASLTFTITVEATDSTAPVYESAAVDESTLTMTWDENLDTSSVPAKTAFTVKVGGTAVDLADTGAVAISGRTVTLMLASAVTSTSTVTVSYTKPTGDGAKPLQDAAGNDVANLTDKEVTNNTSFPGICDRTPEVRTALLTAVAKTDCMAVIETDLTGTTGALNLSSRGITALKSGDFSGLTALAELDLSDNNLSSLPSDVFGELTALRSLVLDENSLGSLPSDVFDGLTSLATLYLYSNALSTLPSDVFDGLTALVTLDLSTNSLSSLPSDVFDGLTALTTLRLEENSLSSLPSDVFDGPTALTTLHLSGNSLGSLPSDVFDGPTALTTLYLDGNSLSSLPSDVFDGPTALTTLHLDGNSLSSLPSDVFDGPAALTTLHLDGNSLSSLPAGLFDGLTSLTTLRLSDNPGAPFPLTLDLERTDGALEAASPATMKVTVREGAPHALTIPLSVTDGTAPASASVAAGGLESATFTVTKSADEQRSRVTLGALPSPASGFDGIRYAAADDLPLTLFDMTAPALESASVNGATLTLTYDEALDEDSQPAASAFTVKGAGEDQTPTEVSVAGMAVTLTLERAASHGDTVTATYTVPSADPIQDPTGNDAAGFEDEEVTNATPDPAAGGGGGPPPAQPPSEGEVSRSGDTVTLTFAEELDETSVPAPSDFTVTLQAASSASSASSAPSVASPQTEGHRVTEVSLEGKALELTISPPVPAGRSAAVAYTPGATPLRTASGARVGAFTTTVAGADEPPPPSEPPTFGPNALSELEVAENTAAGGVVGTVAATASDGVALTYTLAGADGGLFAIDDGGRITVGADTSLDFERRETYEVTVTASAGGAEASHDVTIRVLDVDEPPAAPRAPSVAGASPSSVNVSWSAPANTGPPIDDYDVEYRRAGGDAWSVWEHGDATTSATVTGLDPDTDYEARVRAGNAEGAGPWSAAGRGRTEVQGNAPVAAAGADRDADPGERVTLDGSGSSDPDGDPLTFAWTQTAGAPVTLEGADTARPAFTAPQAAGVLIFSLRVNDGYTDSEADEVTVTIRDLAPSFGDAGIATRRYMLGRRIEPWTLPAASGGNGELAYSLMPVPAGLSFDDSSHRLSGTPAAEGRFTLTYAAADEDGDRATLEFVVRVFSNRPPRADAGEDAEADPGERVTLDGTGSSDPDGDPLTWEWLQTAGEVVTLEEPLTARAAFTAPQQPGTLSFSLTVKDGEFTSEPDGVSVRVRDLAPTFGDAPIDRPSLVQGEAITPQVLPEASGGNGALTYSLTSTPAGLAGLVFDPASRTLSGTPATLGPHTFTYRVEDADANRGDGDAALILFRLTVERPTAARREVLKPTLAAVGTATLNSAVDTIGSRFNGAGGQGSQLTLGGLRLAGGMGPARPDIGGGMLPGGGLAPGGGRAHGGGLGSGGGASFGNDPSLGGMSFGSGPFAAGGPGAGRAGLWDQADSLLLGTSFEWSLAGSPQEAAGDEASLEGRPLRWSLWGRAGVVSFDGRPDSGSRYGGELRTGYVGIDVDAGKWLAGVALARSWSDSDYSFGGGEADFERGRLETTLTAVLPYGRWKLSEKSEAWGVLGMGRGEAAHVAGDARDRRETSDLSMWMAAGGLRHELASRRGYDLALRADGGLARLETADGAQDVDGLDAGSWRARVGLEASRGWLVGENLLTPFVELAGRYDGGDAASGAGLELAGGARYGAARFQLEARGRVLALHSDSGYREKGLSLTAVMNPREDGSGLSLAFGPRWGAMTGGAETLWQDHMPRPRTGGHAPEAGMDAALGYGLPLLPRLGGVLTPFAEARFAGGVRQYRLGGRFAIAPIRLDAELAAERSESASRPPNDRFGFLLRWSFGGRPRGQGLPEAPGTDSATEARQ